MTTKSEQALSVDNRIDFLYFFDVTDGNPNGDPDSGNSPRLDHETGQGLVTDVALKRKVRDFVAAAKPADESPQHKIYIKIHSALHEQREPAYKALEIDGGAKGKDKAEGVVRARTWMCENYYDVRTFGAVMSVTDFNCGQVRGPIQMTFARSIDPIVELDQAIVRKAVEREDAEKQLNKEGQITGTMGRKSIVPYGLYCAKIFFNPHFAKDTGFSNEDLELFVQALKGMFDLDRSATRGEMSACKLIAFVHSSSLGNAPAARLFERVTAERNDDTKPPRRFGDYKITSDDKGLPDGVTIHHLL